MDPGSKALLATILLAFGIVVPLPDFVAGIVLALGGCYGAFIVTEVATRKSVWGTLFLGVMSAVGIAIIHPHLAWINWIPLQFAMLASGALSKFLFDAIVSFGHGMKDTAGGIAKRLADAWMPKGKDGDGP